MTKPADDDVCTCGDTGDEHAEEYPFNCRMCPCVKFNRDES